jgi:hypothetical protein
MTTSVVLTVIGGPRSGRGLARVAARRKPLAADVGADGARFGR